ncbi:cAMP-dependent protein kinase type II regulatory subunit [Trichonephila clavata]|uniref:cGMP-dependent protein kinase n=1 Tax=Trichonephila clavata TaxID=2740835 RepID=A0A8X6LWL6_TRICU|nr:cAMP-dependent protein kinase type II regulatory subunit [Trichonephila clavata]
MLSGTFRGRNVPDQVQFVVRSLPARTCQLIIKRETDLPFQESKPMSDRQISVPPVLENILLEYTITVLVENPDDIISHAADYFTRLRESRGKNEDPAGSSGEKTGITNILGPRALRRQSVVGEKYDPEKDDDEEEEIEKHPKTDEERQKITERTKDIFLFKFLDEDDINEIVEAMMPREIKKGQVIIRQGDDGDFFYVIDKGTFEATVKDSKEEEKVVKTYENSGSFGELALLHNQPRAATIKAKTDGLLWAVSRRTFNKLVVKRAFEKRQKYKMMLEKVPELQPLNEYEKLQVCDALTPVGIKEGETLFREGDEGDGMYFIEEGSVKVTQKSTQKKEEQEVALLGPGEYFGEMALVKKQPRAGTVTALEDTKLAFLEVDAFERLLGPCLDIMKSRMEKYQKA